MQVELIKTYYSVAQNGLFENFTVKVDGQKLFGWSDNSGLHDHSEAGDPLIEERLKSLPPEIGQIYSRMKQAEAAYGTEWEKADGHDVLARDGRKDEFGAEWVLLLN